MFRLCPYCGGRVAAFGSVLDYCRNGDYKAAKPFQISLKRLRFLKVHQWKLPCFDELTRDRSIIPPHVVEINARRK